MKVVFLGPSARIPPASPELAGVEFRAPAGQGDVAAAVLDGATVIGLVDGTFEHNGAVWHKELLFALSKGVQLFGAASMGALRAAECAAFGMIGVGTVFRAYADGGLVDDDAVAVVHAPREMDYLPLSEPLVNVEATFRRLLDEELVTAGEFHELLAAAHAIFFKERTYPAILQRVSFAAGERRAELKALIASFRQDVKRADALELVALVAAAPDRRIAPPTGWQFKETLDWRKLLATVERQRQSAAEQSASQAASA